MFFRANQSVNNSYYKAYKDGVNNFTTHVIFRLNYLILYAGLIITPCLG